MYILGITLLIVLIFLPLTFAYRMLLSILIALGILSCFFGILLFSAYKIGRKLKKIYIRDNESKVALIDICRMIDKEQKKWILKYCKRNKINSVEKIKMLRELINTKIEERRSKYLSPVLFGTLSLVLWEQVCEWLNNEFGIIAMLIVGILFATGILLIISASKSTLKDIYNSLDIFESYSGLKQLDKLLIYAILESKK